MANESLCSELRSFAAKEAEDAKAALPLEPNFRFALFVETLRAIDYWTVFQQILTKDEKLSHPDFTLMSWGWNLAASQLLAPLPMLGGIPIMESSEETRSYAMSILLKFGRAALLLRAADMIQHDVLKAERNASKIILRKAADTSSQFLDLLEFNRWNQLEDVMLHNSTSYGWEPFDFEQPHSVSQRVGSFWARRSKEPLKEWTCPDIASLMLPLIRPWNSGRGIMMEYAATPAVDNHFLAHATHHMKHWICDVGFDPMAGLAETTVAEVAAVATMLVSKHMMHIAFALLAPKNFPQISVPQSLTIWGPEKDLIDNIAAFTEMKVANVTNALRAISMTASEAVRLQNHTTPFMPLLINLENGLVLQPVSSLGRNPLISVIALQEWREPHVRNNLIKGREKWLRRDLYALFQGDRYVCVDGNIALRKDKRTLTDIDAAVFDRTTGELGVFQLKWQDYFTNDVRQLRSKASNLAKELDTWAERVFEWVVQNGIMDVTNSIRLNPKKDGVVMSIYLFALSRNTARTQGYGFSAKHPSLALANWPQFLRMRAQIGPSKRVINDLHQKLWEEMEVQVKCKSIPLEISTQSHTIRFEDLWNSLDEESSKD
jgi:hypothetical protein